MQKNISRKKWRDSGVVFPYTPKNLIKLTMQPRKEEIIIDIPYLVQ